MPKKQLKGKVVSDKMDKTVVVEVRTVKIHPRYKGRFRRDKRYKAHDEKDQFKIGDNVLIEECKPISKDKKWIVKEVLNKSKMEVMDKVKKEDKAEVKEKTESKDKVELKDEE